MKILTRIYSEFDLIIVSFVDKTSDIRHDSNRSQSLKKLNSGTEGSEVSAFLSSVYFSGESEIIQSKNSDGKFVSFSFIRIKFFVQRTIESVEKKPRISKIPKELIIKI